MFNIIIFSILLLITDNFRAIEAFIDTNVKGSFEEYEIAPDFIPVAPDNKVFVNYSQAEVDLGNELSALQVTSQPTDISWESDANEFYALAMIDPDSSTGVALHWLVVNIPGCDVVKGETLASYFSPVPTSETGIHRYIYLVYQQPSEIYFNVTDIFKKSLAERLDFDINDFVGEYDFGNPTAGNFFRSQIKLAPLPNDILTKKNVNKLTTII